MTEYNQTLPGVDYFIDGRCSHGYIVAAAKQELLLEGHCSIRNVAISEGERHLHLLTPEGVHGHCTVFTSKGDALHMSYAEIEG